jgi:hypothetical protein
MEIPSTSDEKDLDSLSGEWPSGVIFERNDSTHRGRLMSEKTTAEILRPDKSGLRMTDDPAFSTLFRHYLGRAF